MSLKTKVKVGNITNLSDARYCAGMGVDMLGFKIEEANGDASASRFKEIANWVSGPEFVLELSELPADRKDINEVGFVELPAAKVNDLHALEHPLKTIITIDFKDWLSAKKDLVDHKSDVTYLLATNASGLGSKVISSHVTEMSKDFAVLLGSEISINKLDEYLSWPIAGLALNGSEETRPGIKDYDHLSSILEKLEGE